MNKELLHIETNAELSPYDIVRVGLLRHAICIKTIEMTGNLILHVTFYIELKNGHNDHKEIEHIIFLN